MWHGMKQSIAITVLFFVGLAVTDEASAVEIKGKVIEATETAVKVVPDSEYLPDIGDKVEIYFEIPGLDEKATVAVGKVSEVSDELIIVKIDKANTKVTKDQLATISTRSLRKRAAPALLVCPSIRSGNTDILLLKADGSLIKSLTSKTDNTYPAWSPDGKKIVVSTSRDEGGGLYVMDADGANVKRLTNGADQGASWSPDGKKIAFTRYSQGAAEVTQIVVVNADGTNPVGVTDGRAFDADPAWSPDGGKIAFASNRARRGFRLYVMNTDGQNVRDLSRSDNPQGHTYPAWSPDGNRIVYTDLSPDNRRHLFLVDADGSNKTQLTKQGAFNTFAAWSPDGKKIAYQSFDDAGKGSLHVMNADGTDANVILRNEGTVYGGRPAWKPN